jgi:TrmH family RNA methyltransferase
MPGPTAGAGLCWIAVEIESERPRRQLSDPEEIFRALDGEGLIQLVLGLDEALCVASQEILARAEELGISTRRVSSREMCRLAPSGLAPEVLALEGPSPRGDLSETLTRSGVVWLLVDCAYPGNAGYVIRSAEVSGAAGVVIASDFDRVKRRDCMRFAMRSDRFLPVHFAEAGETVALARLAGRRVVAIENLGSVRPWQADLKGPLLAIVGGEERGIPPALLEEADATVSIPMRGFLPSYNLQAAMAVVMGEQLRQTSGQPGG